MDRLTIYLAGPLFTLAERNFNQELARHLRDRGFGVILPQDAAEMYRRNDGSLDMPSMARNCMERATGADFIVAILDGADVDSGTAYEAGSAYGRGIVIGVRTDFRSSEDGHTGVNAMFRLLDAIIRYSGNDIEELCNLIVETIHEFSKT